MSEVDNLSALQVKGSSSNRITVKEKDYEKRFIALLIAQALIVSSVTTPAYAADLSEYGSQLEETAVGSELYPDARSGEYDLADGEDALSETDFADEIQGSERRGCCTGSMERQDLPEMESCKEE